MKSGREPAALTAADLKAVALPACLPFPGPPESLLLLPGPALPFSAPGSWLILPRVSAPPF